MTSMRRFEVLAGNLAACCDAGVAIAASRWGATGLLNLDGAPEAAAAGALSQFLAHGRGSLAVKVDGRPEMRDLLRTLPPAVGTVVLATCSSEQWAGLVPAARGAGRRVICECTSEEQARRADTSGADGVIAKGSEAGGHVLEETTFVLVQRLSRLRLPVWAAGGIGLHSAAACYVAGCSGLVVDAALALARESTLPLPVRAAIERMEGDEPVCLGNALGDPFRMHRRAGTPVVEELTRLEQQLADAPDADAVARWRAELRRRMASLESAEAVWPLGQDASFAAPLARAHRTVAGILGALRQAIEEHVRSARDLEILGEGAPLAASHRTRYPILQGPMTRVSDTPEFALAVAEAGALPFLALALMSGPEVRRLLEQTRGLLGDRPWGVGILGFVPPELRERQLEAIREIKPDVALIAGGRPDQAASLERDGIPTYLHVPSQGLLRAFLESGARRFIFEGRECGGHVGPRTSFVLWNAMVDVLGEAIDGGVPAGDLHVVFAGGIHDARSAAMVAALSAPLAARGARIGALLGTAYLLTEEAVKSRAIVEDFQREARDCTHTVLFETGPGHAIRCADTPYFQTFRELKLQLAAEGRTPDEIRDTLESLNLGRLRIASKGIARDTAADGGARYTVVDADRQRVDGMYMLGQVAALRGDVCRMSDLHEDVSRGSTTLLASVEPPAGEVPVIAPAPCDVAIVGIGCVLPGAADVRAFWSNVLNKVDAITEVPRDRFDADRYFSEDGKARDRIVSKWGGFLGDVPFDPVRYGIPPSALPSIDSLQLLALEVVHQALADAGYLDRDFGRDRTSVIFGASGGLGDLGLKYGVRASLPELMGEVPADVLQRLPEWTEDSFAGILLNVAAGRVANRFNFGGVNFTVDAACASSLAAVHLAVRELQAGTSDVAVVGGIDTVQSPFGYMCFSKSQALSPRGRCRTFDQGADGIAISEGVVAFVVKRLADAERDGDRIYAVIKAVAGSSDGRGKGLTAPRPEGQMRALRRAYAQAGISPGSVGLIEAHGTGTVAGDAAEVASLDEVFREAGAAPESCAIGSVKSMIGHTKASAGVAGLMKAALALHHRVLPPTLHVTQPNTRLRTEGSPFFVNTEATPWIGGSSPRRAGVSSFGFGGTNFHAIVEEYTGAFLADERAACDRWPAELFLWASADHEALDKAIGVLREALAQPEPPSLRSLAAAVCRSAGSAPAANVRLAIVASSHDDLRARLGVASEAIAARRTSVSDPRGIFLGQGQAAGRIAFLFPGQGSQFPFMLRDLALQFGELSKALETFDRVLADRLPRRLSAYVYPPPCFSPEEEQARADAITDTEVAQPALGAVEAGLIDLLRSLGVVPDMAAGHSYGEYVALHAAGVIDAETLAALSHTRGRVIKESVGDSPGTMAAVTAPPDAVRTALGDGAESNGVWLVNFNAPQQTIIAGTVAAIDAAIPVLEEKRLRARRIPVACAFHSPLMQGARDRLAEALASIPFGAPRIPVFSNALAAPYPAEAAAIAATLAEHLVSPVRFIDEIRAMYAAGARIFVEVGPRTVLTGLTRRILDEQPDATVIAVDSGEKNGIVQLLTALAQMAASGVAIDTAPLFQRRAAEPLDATLRPRAVRRPASWVVNGAGARPAGIAAAPASAPMKPAPAPMEIARAAQPAPPPIATQPVLVTRPMDDVRPPQALPSIAPSAPAGTGSDEVMLQFQQMMSRFLETQAAVMTAYLESGHRNGNGTGTGAGNGNGHGHADIVPVYAAHVQKPELRAQPRAEITGSVFATPLEPAVQATPAPQAAPPEQPPAVPAPAPVPDFAMLLAQVAAERTGYAPEMLDPDLGIEADLGIDSIKRVEILSAVRKQCVEADQAKLQSVMDDLTRAKTFREMAASMTAAVAGAPPAAAEKPAPAASRRQSASVELLQIVAERTGYPQDMLDPDLNIEADLGIDSIKRVEILSTFRRNQPEADQQRLQAVMDRLTGIKTLRELARVIDQTLTGSDGPATVPERVISAPELAGPMGSTMGSVARTVFSVADAPPLVPASGPARADAFTLVTDDGRGIARELCARLVAGGRKVMLLTQAGGGTVLRDGECLGDWTDEEQVARGLDRIRALGPIVSLVHAAPLGTPAGLDTDIDEWRRRIRGDVRQLYLLVRGLARDLGAAGHSGGASILAATALGGDYGQTAGRHVPPSHGGVIGFLRTAAIELPEVRFRIVDLDPAAQAGRIVDQLRAELYSEGPLEVGYLGDRRVTLVAQPAPLDSRPAISLTSDDVVLLTGGARGITAEVAIDLARRFRPALILAGTSPEPPAREIGEWAGVDDAALRNTMAAEMRRRDPSVRPVDVEAACRRVLADREIRRTLAACAAAGARVEYRSVDVRDAGAFGALIDDVYSRHHRLDVVVHGAGVIEDRLIADKTPASFDRVVHTKTDSVFTLARKLRPEGLRALVLMSSVTAAFGNRGQADYGAANGVYNVSAQLLAAQWPGRVVAANWGPWDKRGMASEEVRRQFVARGIVPIQPESGVRALIDELASGEPSDAVVVFGSGPWAAAASPRAEVEVTA